MSVQDSTDVVFLNPRIMISEDPWKTSLMSNLRNPVDTSLNRVFDTSPFTFLVYRGSEILDRPTDTVNRIARGRPRNFQSVRIKLPLPILVPNTSVCLGSSSRSDRLITEET